MSTNLLATTSTDLQALRDRVSGSAGYCSDAENARRVSAGLVFEVRRVGSGQLLAREATRHAAEGRVAAIVARQPHMDLTVTEVRFEVGRSVGVAGYGR